MLFARLMRGAAALLAIALIGCDPGGRAMEDLRLVKLKPGVSTEQDVRGLFGAPAAVRESGGARGLVYPLGPEGLHTLLLRIGADGKYLGHENLRRARTSNGSRPDCGKRKCSNCWGRRVRRRTTR
jgi:hypothetical protein